MTCPNCIDHPQVAYFPLAGSLVCLGTACSWERRLTEDEIFELFFRGQTVAEWMPEAVSR
jgi:hypothetical protein